MIGVVSAEVTNVTERNIPHIELVNFKGPLLADRLNHFQTAFFVKTDPRNEKHNFKNTAGVVLRWVILMTSAEELPLFKHFHSKRV